MNLVERLRAGVPTENGCHHPIWSDVEKADATMVEAADRIAELEAALDEKEIASGLTSNGNLWRFWSGKARDLAVSNARLQKEIETAREALEPFVRQMEREFPDQWPDAMDVRSLNESRWHLKVGDFRRASAAYAALKDKEVAG